MRQVTDRTRKHSVRVRPIVSSKVGAMSQEDDAHDKFDATARAIISDLETHCNNCKCLLTTRDYDAICWDCQHQGEL